MSDPQSPPDPPHRPELPPPSPVELARATVAPVTKASPETFSRHFVSLSLRRAFRLDIKTDEVLPMERAHLESAINNVRDPEQQAFLAWRRSVLLMVAIMFVPLTISRFFESWDAEGLPTVARVFMLLPVLTEAAFCVVAFDQLRWWAQWRRQRRVLFIAWVLYFIAPFLVWLYPYRTAYDHAAIAQLYKVIAAQGLPIKVTPSQIHMGLGLVMGVRALLVLGPKVISLMPGLIRASIVSKLQFPGTTAPGWLMMLAAPFYALFAYIIVVLPYQVTGSWQFLVGNAGVLLAQIFIGVSGRRLTVPLSSHESYERVHKTWLAYIGILVLSAGFMIYGLWEFIRELHLGYIHIVTGVLSFASNVLLDTLIGCDAIIAAMYYFRRRSVPDPAHEQRLRDAEVKLDVFCG
jgi:hypothetical protein